MCVYLEGCGRDTELTGAVRTRWVDYSQKEYDP